MRRPFRPNWLIEWSNSGFSRKTVVLIDRTTGRRSRGYDWSSWDRALQMALEKTGLTVLSPVESDLETDG
jgi:hypothetical protein